MIMGSRVRIRLVHLFLKNSKSGVDDRGHRLRSGSLLKRSGSPVTNLPGAASRH